MPPAQLMVALDVPAASDVEAVVCSLPPEIEWYKVGLELFTAAGPSVLSCLKTHHKRIFLDLKLHDIPNTVAAAVRTACRHRVDLLTVHATGGHAMCEAAARAAREAGSGTPKIVAVTTLTSLSADDLSAVGITRSIGEQAVALGQLALNAGLDGLVCSVHELETLRATFGPAPILVTPGIRLADDQAGDQKRIATPAEAVRKGSSFLVMGRSLLNAPDPRATATRVLEEMASAQPA